MDIHQIPIRNISVSAINVRKKVEGIDQLAASIAAIGLLSPIIVRPNGSPSTYEVIAGQRRFLAMKQLEKEVIPAIIAAQTDDLTSLEVSLAENFSRRSIDPVEMCEAFMAIKATDETLSASTIADRFGVPVKFVSQCLKLAELPDDIRTFAKKKNLDIRLLEALTIAPPAIQKAWLKAAKKGEWGWQDEQNIRSQSVGQKPKVGENVFDLSEYTGGFVEDLFEDAAYFSDIKQFDELQAAECERQAEALRDEGWSWVKSYPIRQNAPSIHQFGKSKNKKIAGAMVIVVPKFEDKDGRRTRIGNMTEIHTGLLDPETVRQIEKEKKKQAKAEAEGTGSDKDAEAEGGEKPQTDILKRTHRAIAQAANAHAILGVRDHSDLLQIVCDLICDQTIRFVPQSPQSDVIAITGEMGREAFPGTVEMDKKMKPSERIMLLRKMLASAALNVELSVKPIADIRKHWTPGKEYFSKLDKERLAVCAEEIGDTNAAASLRSGKTKRIHAVEHLCAIFEARENYAAPAKIVKAAASWVPKEYLEAQEPRVYSGDE